MGEHSTTLIKSIVNVIYLFVLISSPAIRVIEPDDGKGINRRNVGS
jgi:hypothetical protein